MPAERQDAAVVAVVDGLERVVVAAPHLLHEPLVAERAPEPSVIGAGTACLSVAGIEPPCSDYGPFSRCLNEFIVRNVTRACNAARRRWLGGYAAPGMVSIRTGEFMHDGHRLVYSEYGAGTRPFVLLPGLLLPRSMHDPLARALAERGNRVITLDPLGHGESDRPADMWRYTMGLLAEQVVALLDHLELEEAVVGGTSLGANVTLETVRARARPRARRRDRDAGARQRAARLRRRVRAAARLPDRGSAGRARREQRGEKAAAHPVAAPQRGARLGGPGPEAVRRLPSGPLLRPHRAAAVRAQPARDAARS